MINLFVRYATKVAAPSTNWPHGEPKPTSASGAYDGTPWTAAVLGTMWGFLEAIVLRSATVITDTVDNAVTSELFNALIAITGSKFRFTTDALTRNLTPFSVFSSFDYAVAGDGGGATWRATGVTSLPDAGTIDWPNGLLYDLIGTEFIYDSPEITFEAFNLQYADAVTFQEATGRPIILRAGAEYALAGTSLSLGTGATIKGPAIGEATAGLMPTFTYTGAAAAISISAGGAPREDVLLENFMVDAPSGLAVEAINAAHVTLRGLQVLGGGAGDVIFFGGGYGHVIENIRFNKAAGINNNGLGIAADTTRAVGLYFVNVSNEDWTPIRIDAGANGAEIGHITYRGQGTQAPISDSGAGTVYLDGIWHTSRALDLAAGAEQQDGAWIGAAGYINRIRINYPGPVGTGANPYVLRVGRATAPGVADLDYFLLASGLTSGSIWDTEDINPAALSAADLAAGHVLTFSTDAAAGAGLARIAVQILPYRGRV